MNCEYCARPTEPRNEIEGASVCEICWQLLQNPTTALPLIRGHLTLTLRGKMPEDELKKKIDAFMSMLSTWKRPG